MFLFSAGTMGQLMIRSLCDSAAELKLKWWWCNPIVIINIIITCLVNLWEISEKKVQCSSDDGDVYCPLPWRCVVSISSGSRYTWNVGWQTSLLIVLGLFEASERAQCSPELWASDVPSGSDLLTSRSDRCPYQRLRLNWLMVEGGRMEEHCSETRLMRFERISGMMPCMCIQWHHKTKQHDSKCAVRKIHSQHTTLQHI